MHSELCIMNYELTTKPHYHVLDGLRGVAALMVLIYHIFECFDYSPVPHGNLAVDFFFVLSGFVIGYAYDDRWQKGLTTGQFIRRRLIRLHPMVVIGVLLGVGAFFLAGSVKWDGTHVATELVMLAMLCALFMIPITPGAQTDVRGFTEMFPLNGPCWSLFFEYIGNLLYALLLRRLPTKVLAVIASVCGVILTASALQRGYVDQGWSMAEGGFWGGLVRMLFPYTIGMLMARCFKPIKAKNVFWKCSAVILIIGAMPTVCSDESIWMNGLFCALCIVVVFPCIVWIGASERENKPKQVHLCHLLGDISYPLYAIHYPFMYLFYAYIGFHGDPVAISKFSETWPAALTLLIGCLVLAYLLFHFYDKPVRKRLNEGTKGR